MFLPVNQEPGALPLARSFKIQYISPMIWRWHTSSVPAVLIIGLKLKISLVCCQNKLIFHASLKKGHLYHFCLSHLDCCKSLYAASLRHLQTAASTWKLQSSERLEYNIAIAVELLWLQVNVCIDFYFFYYYY